MINLIKKIMMISLLFILCSCSNGNENEVIIKNLNSVIEISIVDKETEEIITKGTAFSFDKNLFLSARHIFSDFNYETEHIVGETINGDKISLELIKKSEDTDLAILYSPNDIPSMVISENPPYWLDDVYFIGNSRGLGLCINKCYISSPSKNVIINEINYNTIQINGTVNEGDSGGTLLNKSGEIIGVISFKLTTNSGNTVSDISFAISLESINDFLSEIETENS